MAPISSILRAARLSIKARWSKRFTRRAFAPVSMEDAIHRTEKEFFEPNLHLFDAYPGGIGFSEPLYRAHELLFAQTRELIVGCSCESGCPSCVGPAGDLAPRAKEAALAILEKSCR